MYRHMICAAVVLSLTLDHSFVSADYHGDVEPDPTPTPESEELTVHPLNAGWAWSDWLGTVYTPDAPWIFHLQNGWHYVLEETIGGVWMYSEDLEWLFSSRIFYPYLYSHGRGNWVYYLRGTAAPRYFYDFGEEDWFSLPRVEHPTLLEFFADLTATQEIPDPDLTQDGAVGSGIRFEAARRTYAEAADHEALDITGSLTISFWLNIMDGFRSAWEPMVSKGDDTYQVRRSGNTDHLRFDVRGGEGGDVQVTSDYEVPPYTWVHVAAVYDADEGEMRLYFDGEQDANTASRSGMLATNDHGLAVGANFSGTEYRRFANFKLDEVAIFDRALSTANIVVHHSAGMTPAYASAVLLDNPVAYWRFEEMSGTVAEDEQGEHPMVLVNAPRLHRANPRGSATVSLDPESRELSWVVTWEGLTGAPTGLHFHGPADIGETAGVRVNIGGISGLESPSSGSTTLSEEEMADLVEGRYYINLHTEQNGPGEIRGHVLSVTTRAHHIGLSPHQEVPFPLLDGAAPEGASYVVADPDAGLLHWVIKAGGYTSDATNAHFHGPADFGASAGVRQGIADISGLESPMVGSVGISDELMAELLDGLWYVNIHTGNNPPGELRGQVHPFEGMRVAEFPLTVQEGVPPPTLNGANPSGGAIVVYESSTRRLSWVVQYRDTTSSVTGAHFHGPARSGETAGVVVNIGGEGLESPIVGSTVISQADEAELLAGLWYLNVHTEQNGPGEIRGQVVFD